MSLKIGKSIEAHRWKMFQIAWPFGKVRIVKYALIYVYALVNARSEREKMKFWNDMNECLKEIGRGSAAVSKPREMERVSSRKGTWL